MDTDRLKYFCTIAETGSLTKASEILNISHSGLSKAMSVLQEELGEQILRPQGRGLEITEVGKALYLKSKDILELVNRLKEDSGPAKKPFLRIGLAEIFSISLAGTISQELSKEVDFYDFDSGEAEVHVLNNGVHFALSFVPFPHPELEYLKIKKTQMGVFYSNPHFGNLPLEDLPFVVPNTEIKNNPLSIKSRDGWPMDVHRQIAFGASNLSTALQIVEAGSAAIFMPQFVAKYLNQKRSVSNQLQEFELKKSIFQSTARDIYLVKKKNVEETHEMKVISKIVRKLC